MGDITEVYSQEESTEQTYPIAETTQNLFKVHLQELRGTAEQIVPKLNTITTLKRSLREFYTRQSTHLFEFFDAPLETSEPLSQAVTILKRFSRFPPTKVTKIKDLLLDTQCESALQTINEKLAQRPSTDISGCVQQWQTLVEIWKQATQEFLKAQTRLEAKLANYSEIHKKVTQILLLPSNDAYEGILKATEEYLRLAFEENQIDDVYKECIYHAKTLYLLQDSIQSFRHLMNSPTEPVCSICITEPVMFVIAPCGHTFCQTCCQRQSLTCFICKGVAKEKVRLFFS